MGTFRDVNLRWSEIAGADRSLVEVEGRGYMKQNYAKVATEGNLLSRVPWERSPEGYFFIRFHPLHVLPPFRLPGRPGGISLGKDFMRSTTVDLFVLLRVLFLREPVPGSSRESKGPI